MSVDAAALEERFAKLEARLTKSEERAAKMEHERDEYRKLYELVSLELERTRRHLFAKAPEKILSVFAAGGCSAPSSTGFG